MKFVIYIIHTEEQLVRIYCNPPWCCGKKKLWTRTDRIIWFGLYKDDIFLLLHFWRKTIFFWDMIPSWVASYSFRRIPMLFYCTQCIMCRCTVFIPFFTSNCYSVLVVNFPLRHWRLACWRRWLSPNNGYYWGQLWLFGLSTYKQQSWAPALPLPHHRVNGTMKKRQIIATHLKTQPNTPHNTHTHTTSHSKAFNDLVVKNIN